jgi:hypothetical protein
VPPPPSYAHPDRITTVFLRLAFSPSTQHTHTLLFFGHAPQIPISRQLHRLSLPPTPSFSNSIGRRLSSLRASPKHFAKKSFFGYSFGCPSTFFKRDAPMQSNEPWPQQLFVWVGSAKSKQKGDDDACGGKKELHEFIVLYEGRRGINLYVVVKKKGDENLLNFLVGHTCRNIVIVIVCDPETCKESEM